MLQTSRRFRAQLGKSPHWVTDVSWSNDGRSWATVPTMAASVTRSLSDQIHWKASLSLDAVSGRDGINCLNTRIRIRHGIEYGPGDRELYAFGLYRVNSAVRSLRDGSLRVEAASIEDYIIRALLGRPGTYQASTPRTLIPKVIHEVMPDVPVYFDPRVNADVQVPATLVEQDRWAFIDGSSSSSSLAAAIQARVIADRNGGFVVVPVATPSDDPVWTVDAGKLLVDSTKQLDNADVANIVIVTGAGSSGFVVGPRMARDMDPNSPTYSYRPISEGGFGPVPFFYSSSLLTTEPQCDAVALAKLAERIGLKQTVTFDSLHDPTKEPGDVGLVRTPDGLDLVILDAVTYDLAGGPLQADTRTLSTNLDGQIWDPPSDDGGEGDDVS